jgi:LmbE family N-acetylglucosaminyl deacetylase
VSSTSGPQELTARLRHLFLSPHYDDISLSAGATVRLLANLGLNPETLIIFGSEPDHEQPLSSFAEALHAEWGLAANEVVASRQAEERAASAVLGALERILPFRDAIYREDRYRSDDDLFDAPVAAERELPSLVAAALDLPPRPDAQVRLYAPLAIGRHVDHQLAFATGSLLARQGWDVWFYEDTPYALAPGAFDTRMAEIAASTKIVPAVQIPAESTWDAKIDAILCYPSQLETVFREYVGVGTSRDEISAALRAYATWAGEGQLAERFWKIADASSGAGS